MERGITYHSRAALIVRYCLIARRYSKWWNYKPIVQTEGRSLLPALLQRYLQSLPRNNENEHKYCNCTSFWKSQAKNVWSNLTQIYEVRLWGVLSRFFIWIPSNVRAGVFPSHMKYTTGDCPFQKSSGQDRTQITSRSRSRLVIWS